MNNKDFPCTELLFLIEDSTSYALRNQRAASVFVKSFQHFVVKGVYDSNTMGGLCLSSKAILEAFHDELARYLLLYNARDGNAECKKLLKQEWRHARRIAVCLSYSFCLLKYGSSLIEYQKWQSLCNASSFDHSRNNETERILGHCGAEICSSDESEDDHYCNLSPSRRGPRRWKKNWRSKKFTDMLHGLRGRSLYCGDSEAVVLEEATSCRVPPEGTPIELIDEDYLRKYGISHVGIRR